MLKATTRADRSSWSCHTRPAASSNHLFHTPCWKSSASCSITANQLILRFLPFLFVCLVNSTDGTSKRQTSFCISSVNLSHTVSAESDMLHPQCQSCRWRVLELNVQSCLRRKAGRHPEWQPAFREKAEIPLTSSQLYGPKPERTLHGHGQQWSDEFNIWHQASTSVMLLCIGQHPPSILPQLVGPFTSCPALSHNSARRPKWGADQRLGLRIV